MPIGPGSGISRGLKPYLLAVSLAGTTVLVALVTLAPPEVSETSAAEFLMLIGLVVAGELYRIKVPRHASEITLSTTFAFAVLLLYGPAVAALALALASVAADVTQRKGATRTAFNVGQYAVSMGAASLALAFVGTADTGSGVHFQAGDLPALLAAAAAFFLVNNVLAGTASALATHVPVVALLLDDVLFHAMTTTMLVGLTPIVVITVDAGPWLVPLLAVPIAAVYRGAREAEYKEHQARHDALTGLANRTLFRARAAQTIKFALGHDRGVAILIMDVDRFKEVNDTLGHHHGDLLLKEIGQRVGRVLREGDTVARLGGDEFAVVVGGLRGHADALSTAARIVSALGEPFALERFPLAISASIGIACFPEHGIDVDRLLQRADIAMYVSKATKTGPVLYSEDQDTHSVDRLRMAGELRSALDADALALHYQPKVDLHSGRIVAAEALVRWRHPDLGVVPPNEFIGIAEQTGMIRDLTQGVLARAISQSKEWRSRGLAIPISVNVSVRDLERTFPLTVAELLEAEGVPASALALEITESVVMADPTRAGRVLHQLSSMGLGIAIDDFGTGYSSLSYLQRLPVSELKIDRSFVLSMGQDEGSCAIVRSTVDLAHHFGLKVVAEGIEDEVTSSRLAAVGCDLGQGYHFARPLPPEEFFSLAYPAAPVLVATDQHLSGEADRGMRMSSPKSSARRMMSHPGPAEKSAQEC